MTDEWCQPGDIRKRQFIVTFDDPDCTRRAVFDDEAEARKFWERANLDYNCYLFGAMPRTPSPETNVDAPDAFELRYREGFEDGEKHAADELALAQSYRDTYKGILDELQERGLTPGTIDIIKERRRQIAAEGWTPEHDDEHTDGSLALAAGSYCESAARPKILARKPGGAFAIPKLWPQSWSRDWWKPKSPREDLVRAGALIIAEIERIDRAAAGVEKP